MITPTTDPLIATAPGTGESGLGALQTERGNLPLERLDLRARITGLLAHTELEQGFHNPYDQPLEATYIFPLPDRAAVTGMRMTADDRVVEAVLAERGQARAQYEQAIAAGRRAAIAEEERPDVFTMRVGNILPGERVTVTLTLAGALPYEDGEATYRFPLVVAPRYIPGTPLPEGQVGDGYAPDTDAVPDASRITPPVLLPGFPYPVRLGIDVSLETGGLPLTQARCSLPVEEVDGGWRVRPGQRADRDFVLRLEYGDPVHTSHALAVSQDPDGDEGTFQLTVLPPADVAPPRPRDVVLVLDRSGSMRGWKMAAARRAAARIVDTLTAADRFAVLAFDNVVERPPALPPGLVAGTDRHRFRAVEHLAGVAARGGTELLAPLREALGLLAADTGRDQVLVLVTDGQVGNEDQILRESAALAQVRVHTIGIDKAVNAGFLGRLAAAGSSGGAGSAGSSGGAGSAGSAGGAGSAGAGRCELVESEDRLDEAADRIHRRIGSPLVTGVSFEPDGLAVLPGTVAPARMPDLFPGAPMVLTGRYRGSAAGALQVRGTTAAGEPWQSRVGASAVETPALAAVWARAHLRELEDRYVAASRAETGELEQRIVATSLRFSVLCRFTAYVATDTRTVTSGGTPHRVVQPVEPAAGWDLLAAPAGAMPAPGAAAGRLESLAMPAAMMGRPATRQPGGSRARQQPPAGRERITPPTPPTGPKPVPGAPPVAPPAPVAALAVEAARLRDAASAPEPQRRQLLADLASRLEALLRQWRFPGTDRTTVEELRALVAELPGDTALRLSGERFGQAWDRMQRLLDALTRGAAPTAPGSPRRRSFWKRE